MQDIESLVVAYQEADKQLDYQKRDRLFTEIWDACLFITRKATSTQQLRSYGITTVGLRQDAEIKLFTSLKNYKRDPQKGGFYAYWKRALVYLRKNLMVGKSGLGLGDVESGEIWDKEVKRRTKHSLIRFEDKRETEEAVGGTNENDVLIFGGVNDGKIDEIEYQIALLSVCQSLTPRAAALLRHIVVSPQTITKGECGGYALNCEAIERELGMSTLRVNKALQEIRRVVKKQEIFAA